MRFLSFLIPICLAASLASCGPEGSNGTREAKGDRVYGGTFRVSETEKFQTLYPFAVTDVISSNICYQVYEGLLRFNPRNVSEVLPALAESWSVDKSGTVYTFKIRKGVFFHDDPCFTDGKGRELTADDFKYSFQLLCTKGPLNAQFSGTFKDRVKGANEYYDASENPDTAKGIEGIKVIDANTLQITLTAPSNSFKYILASPGTFVIPHEAFDKYGEDAHIGTGPFIPVKPDQNGERLVLVKNKNYYGVDSLGNQLPFLDSVIISFYPTKAKELDSFKQGLLDVVFGLPPESISEMVESQIKDFQNKPPKYILDRTPELETQYYEFNTTKVPFNNVKVRQAFNYAIDRVKIIEDILKGEAYGPGIYGITPPGFKGYDTAHIKGYNFDPGKARKLLAEAGYPDGKNFPTVKIELNSGGAKHSRVVEEIKNQLKEVLNVNVEYEIVPLRQKLEDAKYGRSDIYRTSWVADFPSPENFLWTLYGGSVPDKMDAPSFPNTPRYKNALFDSLYLAGKMELDNAAALDKFAKAEQVMLNDAPVMVLWYVENLKLANSYVKNFYFNPIRQWILSEVYFKKTETPIGGEGNVSEKKEK